MSTTYLQARTKVEQDLDLEEETFIQDTEMLGYFNEAVREVESEISTIYEDYYLSKTNLALVNGTSQYSLPSGIFANKIRGIIYNNSSIIYEITRIRTAKKFLDRSLLLYQDPTDEYRYILLNTSVTAGVKIELTPPAKETSSTNVVIWFLREIVELALDADILDVPEAALNFIYALVKGKCKQKENMGMMPDDAKQEIEQQRAMMTSTLSNRVPDDDNEVTKDISFYQESS